MSNGSPPRSAHRLELDYLARLVDRAAQRAPLLERRRPSLFEQPAGQVPHAEDIAEHVAVQAGLPRPAASSHTVPLRAAPRTGEPPLRQSAASMTPRAAALDAMAPEEQAVHVTPPQAAGVIVDTQLPEPAQQSIARRRATPELSSQVASPLSHVEPAVRGVTSIEHIHHHTERVVEVHHGVAQSLVPREPRRERVPALETAAERNEHASPSTPPLTAPALSANWTRLARPEAIAQPVRVAAVRTAAASTPAAPAPVQISIGRVEVRATVPAATAKPRSAPRAPQLSLEEYLRERGGSSR